MKATKESIKIYVNALFLEGVQILVNETDTKVSLIGVEVKKQEKHESLSLTYNAWYTKSLSVIKTLANDRYDDFVSHYKSLRVRKQVSFENYTIYDFLFRLPLKGTGGVSIAESAFAIRLNNQVSILKGVLERLNSILDNIEGLLQADIFDTEIGAAKELLTKKHLRAGGVLAGVVLERHLKNVVDTHSIKIAKAKPMLNDLNEALKNADVYDVPTWRRIQSLADIRNVCAHGTTEREPSKEEVEDLINGVNRMIKNIF